MSKNNKMSFNQCLFNAQKMALSIALLSSVSSSMVQAGNNCYESDISLTLETDRRASETSWELTNSKGKKIYTGKNHKDRTLNIETFELSAGEYQFQIKDKKKNGICCDNGQGYYQLSDSRGEIIVRSGKFGKKETTKFCVGGDPGEPAITYLLTMKNASGSGDYEVGESVTISADTPPADQVFDRWLINADSQPQIDNITAATTTLLMGSSDAVVKATFKKDDGTPPPPPPTGNVDYAIPKDAYGVWDKRGSFMNDDAPDFIKGHGVHIEWTDLQPNGPDSFEFGELEKKIKWAKQHKKYVYLKVYPLDNRPVSWMPKHGVELNTVTQRGKSYTYPNYTDPDYLKLYQNMVEGLAQWVFVDLKEKGLRDTVSHLFVQVGVSGDPKAYHDWSHNELLPKSAQLDGDEHWEKLKFEMAKIYNKAFHESGYKDELPFYFNSIGADKKEQWEWLVNNVPKYGIKPNNAPARGHILSDQADDVANYRHLIVDPPKGKLMFLKNESDQTFGREIASENRGMYSFWAVLNALQVGLSIVDASKDSLGNEHHDSWRFFDKYGASLFPSTSPHAYIFFHFGLDTTDYKRFPDKGEFAGNDSDIKRGQAIARAYADSGAREPEWEKVTDKKTGKTIDWHYLQGGQVNQRHYATYMHDVGKNIWRTNYNRFIEEIDFMSDSYPLWRVGKQPGSSFTNKDSKYSRYGRGINYNKDGIYMKFSKDFFTTVMGGEQVNNGEYKVTLEVRYYDNEKGEFKLGYDAIGGDKYRTITKKGSGEFQVETITITDGYFGKRGPKGADFWLTDAADGGEDIFSSIEMHREPQ